MSRTVWVIGSAVLDTVFSVDHMPRPGSSSLASAVNLFLGGKGSNQAVAAHKLGADVRLIECLGQDEAGEMFLTAYRDLGMPTDWIRQTSEASTGQANICVDATGQNQIAVYVGSNGHLTASDITEAGIQEDDLILCQLEVPNEVIHACGHAGRLILNPAPPREIPQVILDHTWALTPNESEVEALTGVVPSDDTSAQIAANRLMAHGAEHVVITLGDRGCFYANHQMSHVFHAPSVKAADTTGAGDVFNGGLLAGLAHEWSFIESVKFALLAASLSVTKPGAMASIPSFAEVVEFAKIQGQSGPWESVEVAW